jgi:hypothetical protein
MATDGLRRSVGSAVDVTLQLACIRNHDAATDGLSSTGFALADAGNECLILQPSEAPAPFTIAPRPGAYPVEWHSLRRRDGVRPRAHGFGHQDHN